MTNYLSLLQKRQNKISQQTRELNSELYAMQTEVKKTEQGWFW